jgi:hypothetical protein
MREFRRLASRLVIALVLSATCGGAAVAQEFTGKVTLPYEVHWGSAVLPVGEYTLRMDPTSGLLSVFEATGRTRVSLFGRREQTKDSEPAGLLVTSSGSVRFVRSLNCPVWKRKVIYKPFTRAERDQMAENGQTEMVRLQLASR